MDVPRCLFFTRDSDDYVKKTNIFTWFWKAMVLALIFNLFSLDFFYGYL